VSGGAVESSGAIGDALGSSKERFEVVGGDSGTDASGDMAGASFGASRAVRFRYSEDRSK